MYQKAERNARLNGTGRDNLDPVMADFVIKPEDWKYSSTRDFNGMKGLIVLSYT